MTIKDFLDMFSKDRRGFYKMDGIYSYSIDGNKTKIRDDAFSLVKTDKGNLLLIHITYMINEDSYHNLSDTKIKNLVKYYGVSKLRQYSLDKGQLKDTLTLILDIDTKGLIKEFKFVKSVINLDVNHTFKDVNFIFQTNLNKKKSQQEVHDLKELYKKMYPEAKKEIFSEHIVCKYMQLYDYALGTAFQKNNVESLLDEISLKKKVGSKKGQLNNIYVRGTSPMYDQESYFVQLMVTDFILNENEFQIECLREFYLQNKEFLVSSFSQRSQYSKICVNIKK